MDRAAISDQIDRILRSQSFASKSQLRKLLEVLFENMDSESTLKPDRVIKELWPQETRTKGSADVATEMNRLRHALESYYSGEGKTAPVVIFLPNRTLPGPDGMPEKRWIAAKPRGEEEDGGAEHSPGATQAQFRRGLKKIALMVALGAALAVAAYVSIRVLAVPDQPALGRLEGSALVIMNFEGKELWRKVFPEGFGPDWYYTQPRIWFGDLEGKGHTSVLFSYSPAAARFESHPSTLICYSDRGKQRWRRSLGGEVPELNGSSATFKTLGLAVLKATEKKPPRIVVSSWDDPWWPNQIALLDSDGHTISEYWHSGGLNNLVLADLDGDGRQEIVATGVANGYDHRATLVVLDPDRVFGASIEVRPEFQIHGKGVAQERLRLLFPRSDLNRALFQFNDAVDPTIEQGNLRIAVDECTAPTFGCPILYEFDKSFHLIAAFAGGDEFRSAHEKFYQTGKDAHTLSAEEQATFQRVRCLVGCKSEFVPVGKLVP